MTAVEIVGDAAGGFAALLCGKASPFRPAKPKQLKDLFFFRVAESRRLFAQRRGEAAQKLFVTLISAIKH